MTLDEVIKLSWMIYQMPPENIKQGIIGADMVQFATSADGRIF